VLGVAVALSPANQAFAANSSTATPVVPNHQLITVNVTEFQITTPAATWAQKLFSHTKAKRAALQPIIIPSGDLPATLKALETEKGVEKSLPALIVSSGHEGIISNVERVPIPFHCKDGKTVVSYSFTDGHSSDVGTTVTVKPSIRAENKIYVPFCITSSRIFDFGHDPARKGYAINEFDFQTIIPNGSTILTELSYSKNSRTVVLITATRNPYGLLAKK